MEIVIESPLRVDPEARRLVGVRPMVLVGNPVGGSSSHPPTEYFATLSNHQRLLASGSSPEGLSGTPVRRVDRSGLLEMPLRDPGMAAARRVDRSGLLESVSEIPDQVSYAESRFQGATTTTTTTTTTTSLTLPRARCRDRRVGNNEPKEAPASLLINDIKRSSPNLNSATGDYQINDRSKKNLKIFNNGTRNRGTTSSTTAGLSIPDVIEAHEIPTGNSREDDRDGDRDNEHRSPEGERVEAEGCEHTAIESIEEARVAFKGAKKIMNNKENKDGIQTLRVIILSEQL